ncbi:MAG: MetQ/NlpA family ABC transporter substrate-binding protein [Succinivibrio sp.]
MKKSALAAIAAAAIAVASLFQASQAAVEVRLGVVGDHNEPWVKVQEKLKGEGIDLKLIKFGDYTLPNKALDDGEIDLNAFQHVAFLNEDVRIHGYRIERFGNTIIVPLCVYSTKIRKLGDLKDGDSIAIPNDATNGGRALKVLELGGVIKTDPAKGYVPTPRDVVDNPRHLKFVQVDAATVASVLPDVAAGIINNNYAVDYGFKKSDAIFSDGVGKIDEANPYINVVAVRTSDKNRSELKKVVEAYQTREIAEYIKTLYEGTNIPAFKY